MWRNWNNFAVAFPPASVNKNREQRFTWYTNDHWGMQPIWRLRRAKCKASDDWIGWVRTGKKRKTNAKTSRLKIQRFLQRLWRSCWKIQVYRPQIWHSFHRFRLCWMPYQIKCEYIPFREMLDCPVWATIFRFWRCWYRVVSLRAN